jgi:hypothetical protein
VKPRKYSMGAVWCINPKEESEKRLTSIAGEQSESGKHEGTNTSEGLRLYVTRHTILEIWGWLWVKWINRNLETNLRP